LKAEFESALSPDQVRARVMLWALPAQRLGTDPMAGKIYYRFREENLCLMCTNSVGGNGMQRFYGCLTETPGGTQIVGAFRCSRIQQAMIGWYFALGSAALVAALYCRSTVGIVGAALYLILGAVLFMSFRAIGGRSKDRLMEFIQGYLLK